MSQQAQAFLKKYCYDCHGGPNDVGQAINITDRDVLLRKPEAKRKRPYVVPGKPQYSLIWLKAVKPSGQRDGTPRYQMPPDDAEVQPTPEERQVLERWIDAGAQFPRVVERKFLDDKTVLTAIRNHLNRLKSSDQPYQRLHHARPRAQRPDCGQ